MIPLAGYADRLSVRPEAPIRFHVANATGAPVTARVVRVSSADANPAGPGIRLEPVEAALRELAAPGPAPVPRGSHAVVDGLDAWLDGRSFSVACRLLATRPGQAEQAVLARLDPDGGRGFALALDAAGHLCGLMGDGSGGLVRVRARTPVRANEWLLAWLAFDAERRVLRVGSLPLRPRPGRGAGSDVVEQVLDPAAGPGAAGPLLMAAWDAGSPRAHLDGRMEAPALYDHALAPEAIESLAANGTPPLAVARWDFSQGISTSRIVDAGPNALHGRVVNTPVRGVPGSGWQAREMCWRHAPEEFAAIHFHADDLDDCRWPACYEWTPTEGTRSAVYALLLEAGEARENIPFHVVPPQGRATARLAVLASTFTYTVYGNHARPEWVQDPDWQAAWREQSAEWGGYPHNPGDHAEYGLSTYNWHEDGSGISIASWHRPMLNVRIGYLTYPYPEIRASGLRHFPADSHLLAWLEHRGIEYDVITDWELHHEGHDLLARYPLVLTGSHPEYHTREMIDALEAYRDGGGRFCYLGGNGFYWKIALSPEQPGVVEIRRAEGGIRAWAAEPGEYYNQFDGEYGGLWRRNGRPPQELCGVGFTAQGNFVGSHYRRRAEADDPRVAWILDGIETQTFGGHGLSGHGAAGFELDRADLRLGTPEHALVVASSEDHPPAAPWVLVPEEMLTHIVTWPGEPSQDLIRADMVFFETPGGGAVFSTGSITFCGSLPTNGFDNDAARLLENVVERFLDPEPFEIPGEVDEIRDDEGNPT
jgi:N,N-dimethylformamidase